MDEMITNSLTKINTDSAREVMAILAKKNGAFDLDIDFGEIWKWQDFNLGETKIGKTLQTKIITELSLKRFLEAYYIEKAGMTFAAKMSLLSESLDEQKLFSHFAAEEATHFNYVQNILNGVDLEQGQDSFIDFLNEIISHGQRRPLICMIQVVLEGWGIDHYGQMERTCLHPEIKVHLKNILKDEAAHHGSGVALFRENDLTEAEFRYTEEMLAEFIQMVRVGPISLHNTINKFVPEMSTADFKDLSNAEADTQRKLDYLKSMLLKAGASKLTSKLDSLFIPELILS